MAAVATVVGRCTPDDVLANRLDPWHGVWLHPYSFAQLRVLDHAAASCSGSRSPTPSAGRLGVPVIAEFTCPDPRTVTMQIVDGEGVGSVVETHATPLADGAGRAAPHRRHRGGRRPLRPARVRPRPCAPAAALRPAMRYAARRLWRDDLAYAERRYALRSAPR